MIQPYFRRDDIMGTSDPDPSPRYKIMKALSGYAEWFWLMAKNWKDVENRGWSITRYFKRDEFPVRVYLHASKKPASKKDLDFIRSKLTPAQRQEFNAVDWSKYRGRIIGEITFTDEVTFDDIAMPATRSPWFFGEFGFVAKDGELYERPIPCRGQLGFFNVSLESLSAAPRSKNVGI